MPIQSLTAPSLISPKTKSYRDVKAQTVALRQQGPLAVQVSEALDTLQSQNDLVFKALQQGLPLPDEYQVLDANGKLVAALGYIIGADHKVYLGGFFRNLYIGPNGPDTAVFYSDGISVQIGKSGWISVLDPYDGISAWIGTQKDQTKAVTGAANNGSGAIRLTVVGHNYTSGDLVNVLGVGGVPNAAGQWVVTVVDANHIDLIGSTWAGAYTSGGTTQRYFAGGAFEEIAVGGATRITNAADNGSGLIRITAVGHRIQTGWLITVTGVGGVPNANGYWYATRIDADHLDLQGSTFAGAYTTGGRVFAWAAASFRAQANGDLYITNAIIELIGTGNPSATITLDPNHGTITVAANPPGTLETVLDSGGLSLFSRMGGQPGTFIYGNSIVMYESVTQTQVWPPLFSASGNFAAMLPDTISVLDGSSTTGVWLDVGHGVRVYGGTGTPIAEMDILGNVNGETYNVGGTEFIDSSLNMHNLASVDSAAYKVGGTPGLGVAQTIIENLVFTTTSAVTAVSGPGVSSVTTTPGFVTGGVFTTKLLTFNSGLLTNDV